MTSILTNNSAMAALQTLRAIGTNMTDTQRQVSSGLRVQVAADNAAYWSISTTMRSDNMALSAVQDALGLGAAKVDVAYAAMEVSVDLVSEIKARIVSASEAAVDRSKLQEEISQLQQQLIAVSDSASFNGENWLKAPLAHSNDSSTENVVGSFTRDVSGVVKVNKFNYVLNTDTVLFDTGTDGIKHGLLDFEETYGSFEGYSIPVNYDDGSSDVFDSGFFTSEELFDVTIGNGGAGQYAYATISQGGKNHSVLIELWSGDNYPQYYEYSPGIWMALGSYGDNSVLPSGVSEVPLFWEGGFPFFIKKDGPRSYLERGLDFSVTTLDLTAIDRAFKLPDTRDAALREMLGFVDRQLEKLVSATAKLGSLSSRIAMQQDFASVLQSSITKGIGRLVDADMDEASTRLKALQTQQQLAIQSLSIANTSGENIRQLFQ